MTKLAESYYQGRAEQFGIDQVPPILNGQPVPLSPEGTPLSIHGLSRKVDTPTSEMLTALLEETHTFLAETLPADYKGMLKLDDKMSIGKNEGFARRALTSLLVSGASTNGMGKVKNARIEALAFEETNEATLKKLRGLTIETTDIGELHEAYFHVTGDIHTGAKSTTRHGLAVVSMMFLQRQRQGIPDEHKSIVPIYRGSPVQNVSEWLKTRTNA